MTLPFDERILNDGDITPENFKYANFVGYLNPKGTSIDYSLPFGLEDMIIIQLLSYLNDSSIFVIKNMKWKD